MKNWFFVTSMLLVVSLYGEVSFEKYPNNTNTGLKNLNSSEQITINTAYLHNPGSLSGNKNFVMIAKVKNLSSTKQMWVTYRGSEYKNLEVTYNNDVSYGWGAYAKWLHNSNGYDYILVVLHGYRFFTPDRFELHCKMNGVTHSVTNIQVGNLDIFRQSKKAPKIHTFKSNGQNFDTNSFFYDNGKEVIVFGAQFTFEAARELITDIRNKTKNPITYVVVTHPNPDKFNGVTEFQKIGAKAICSNATNQSLASVHAYKKHFFVNVIGMFTEDTYPTLPVVDIVFDTSYDLVLKNGETIKLRELHQEGISSNQTIAIVREKAVFVGDLVHHNAHAWLEGSLLSGQAQANINSWISVLEQIQNHFDESTVIFGGRGNVAYIRNAIPQQIVYLRRAKQIVEEYINSLPNPRDVQGENASKHHLIIQKIFEEEYPNYKFPYMIQFGIYGLINSIFSGM